ncbi:MAG: hypothetical protein WBL72_12965 [Thermoguttaceae bacterium]|jgi:hypothetical protein
MNKRTDRLIEVREAERRARKRLEELVNQFLRVAEGLYNWQNADFDWLDNRFALVPRQPKNPDENASPNVIDVPTLSDIHDAVLEAQAAAKNLGEAMAGLPKQAVTASCG